MVLVDLAVVPGRPQRLLTKAKVVVKVSSRNYLEVYVCLEKATIGVTLIDKLGVGGETAGASLQEPKKN